MKKLTLFLATILCACLAIAQVPQTMNFQALIRNAENEVVTNQQVDVEVRVLNASQTAVYVETHSVTTSSGGVATMEIGAGTPVSGSFAAIDWAAGRYYLETRIQLPDGSDALTDVSPLLSVPYSLYAAKAGEVDIDLSEYAKKSDIPEAVDLSDYALKSEIPSEVSLEEYAKKSEIPAMPDLSGYALKSEIPAEVDLTDYAKSADIESAYAKKTDLNNYALVSQIPDEVDLTDYAKSADIESAYAKKTDLNNYALVSQIPDEVDLTDYAKSADIESAYAKKTALNEYTKSGANISVFVNDVEYVKKSYVDSLFNVLKAQIAAIPNGGGNGGNGGETGKIDAKFSVAADKQVYFSKGNLQYQASTKTWRFAENQYDIVGADNENISSSNTGWIDLFGYGTSGYGDCHPYNSGQYDSYPNSYSVGQISETNYDWGYYNKISNGGGQAGLWRTLTGDEWTYLFSSRTNAENLYGAAQVNGVSGVVVLPDDWTLPEGVSFTKGFNGTSLYELNVYSTADWAKMEENGAVFLPAVGYRLGTTVNDAGEVGYYWSAIEDKSVQFSGESIRTDYMWQRSNGQGVRVVQDAE